MSSARSVPVRVGLVILGALLAACASRTSDQPEDEFSTSGSREADQRAEQRMTAVEQQRGTNGSKQRIRTLYERLGRDRGVAGIVDDFVERAMADPRVNWARKGVTHGGFLGIGTKSAEWDACAERVDALKAHMRQFLTVATGGPSSYEGRDLNHVHEGMGITNAEFDATIGDLKATLDKLRLPNPEQKELLAVLESARPQIVEER